jgi:hypothetical protein
VPISSRAVTVAYALPVRRERLLTFRMPMPAWVRERNGGF